MSPNSVSEAAGSASSSDPGPLRPMVSIVVVSLDRRDELREALASLENQRLNSGRFEVIVVDDGSSDGTWEMLTQSWIPGRRHGETRRLALRNVAPIRPGAARNLGASHARGEILAFMDSDCLARPGWLGELVRPFSDLEVGAVGGAEIAGIDEAPMASAVDFALTSPLTTGRLRGGTGRRAGRYRPRSFSMAVRRQAFERAGGFPDMFYGEDLALSLQIEQLGGRLIFAAKSGVHHRRRATLRSVARQAFCMGRARARLTRLNRGHFELIYTLPALITVGAAVLSVLCLLWPGFRPPGIAAALTGAAYLGLVGIAAALSKRAAAVALLAPVVFVIQQLAYGLGFLGGAVLGVQKGDTGLGFG